MVGLLGGGWDERITQSNVFLFLYGKKKHAIPFQNGQAKVH